MTKISALSDIGTSVASNDTFVLVDVSDPTTPNKKIQQQNILAAGGLLPDGSAGTPGLRFLSDTDVGLFRPTTNTLAIATGGSERLRISSSGNVYIGTTAGNAPFTVAGTNIEVINTNGAYVNNSQTTSVSTSATTIVADAGFQGRLWVINGATGGDRFCDLVMASTGAAPVVVQSFTAIGSPAARTYTRSGSALQLAMASGTYDVRCIGMGA